MVTSISFGDIKYIGLQEDLSLPNTQIVVVKGGGKFEVKGKVNFGIGAIFGEFEPIVEDIKNGVT